MSPRVTDQRPSDKINCHHLAYFLVIATQWRHNATRRTLFISRRKCRWKVRSIHTITRTRFIQLSEVVRNIKITVQTHAVKHHVDSNGKQHSRRPRRYLKHIYTVIHNYGNPYEKWNIFVARPHLWLQLGTVKPDIMLCEMVLNNVCMLMLDWNS